jgi:hypothetical protein
MARTDLLGTAAWSLGLIYVKSSQAQNDAVIYLCVDNMPILDRLVNRYPGLLPSVLSR